MADPRGDSEGPSAGLPGDDASSGSEADEVRRRLRALYQSIESEPLPDDLRALAERLQREGTSAKSGSLPDDDAG